MSTWPDWDQPSLASSQVPADVWERDRRPPQPMALTDDVATAAALVAAGGCSPQCLVSPGGEGCACSCAGAYHGLLADVDLRQSLRQRAAAG
jgi:hypothetical protein